MSVFSIKRDAYVVRWARNAYEDRENWTLDDGENAILSYDLPSHWMPLPALPDPPADRAARPDQESKR